MCASGRPVVGKSSKREVLDMAEFSRVLDAITGRRIPSTVPLYEHGVDDPIICEIMGFDFSDVDWTTDEGQVEAWKRRITFYEQMGYDYVPVEMPVRFAQVKHKVSIGRGWVDEQSGPIQTLEHLDNPAYWPEPEDAFNYDLFQRIAMELPEGMKVVGGASGGPFEHASFLTGVQSLCIAIYESEEFVARLFQQIGSTLVEIAKRLVRLDELGVYRFGDDLGFKTATILSPAMLRKYVFPWQKLVVEEVHRAGKPFLLHSCGQLELVMEDLIEYVGIDAKHSFEEAVTPVVEAKKRWGNRIGIAGGIDVDFLSRATVSEIKEASKRAMDICSEGGGFLFGSGNTVTNYVPVENYLAMIEAAREFNGT